MYFSLHEMYNMWHALDSVVVYTRFSVGAGLDDYTLYEVGRRVCEHISDVFGPEGYRHEIPGHAEIELAMMKFADLCDEYEGVGAGDKYRWTVAQLNWGRGRTRTNPVEQRRESTYTGGGSGGNYAQDNLPLELQTTAVGHAVRCMYYYTGATDQAIWMPETSQYTHLNNLKFPYLNTITNVYNSTSETNTYITGGLGSGESSEGFGNPYHIRSNNGYTEVCAAIAGANWYQRLGLYHEETKYADSYERALYNGVLVGVTLEGTRFAYSTRLDESTARAEWQGCACCPPNVIRTVANASGYMYTVRQDNIFVNMFGGSTGHINVQGDDVIIRQVTQYPWEGEIEMTITPPADKAFTLNLRVPGWVKAQKYQQVTLLLDGEEIDATANAKGYIAITRQWPAAGTVINYNIPMEIRVTEGDINVARVYSAATDRYSVLQSQWDKVAVERGPIVYTLSGERAERRPERDPGHHRGPGGDERAAPEGHGRLRGRQQARGRGHDPAGRVHHRGLRALQHKHRAARPVGPADPLLLQDEQGREPVEHGQRDVIDRRRRREALDQRDGGRRADQGRPEQAQGRRHRDAAGQPEGQRQRVLRVGQRHRRQHGVPHDPGCVPDIRMDDPRGQERGAAGKRGRVQDRRRGPGQDRRREPHVRRIGRKLQGHRRRRGDGAGQHEERGGRCPGHRHLRHRGREDQGVRNG